MFFVMITDYYTFPTLRDYEEFFRGFMKSVSLLNCSCLCTSMTAHFETYVTIIFIMPCRLEVCTKYNNSSKKCPCQNYYFLIQIITNA